MGIKICVASTDMGEIQKARAEYVRCRAMSGLASAEFAARFAPVARELAGQWGEPTPAQLIAAARTVRDLAREETRKEAREKASERRPRVSRAAAYAARGRELTGGRTWY